MKNRSRKATVFCFWSIVVEKIFVESKNDFQFPNRFFEIARGEKFITRTNHPTERQ
jgi:hypothetical protein